eukprot:7091184-Prymnesium_polylepis.1
MTDRTVAWEHHGRTGCWACSSSETHVLAVRSRTWRTRSVLLYPLHVVPLAYRPTGRTVARGPRPNRAEWLRARRRSGSNASGIVARGHCVILNPH